MPLNKIHVPDEPCGSYKAGHHVHWIQAKRSFDIQPTFTVSVAIRPDGSIQLEGNGISLSMWNHDLDRLREDVDFRGTGLPREGARWLPRFHLLAPLGSGCRQFSLSSFDGRTPCHAGARQRAGESPRDFVARAVRDDGGYTLPGNFFQTSDDDE